MSIVPDNRLLSNSSAFRQRLKIKPYRCQCRNESSKDIPNTQIGEHKILGDRCKMPRCEIKSPAFGMLGDNSPNNMANLLFYVIYHNERKHRSRV